MGGVRKRLLCNGKVERWTEYYFSIEELSLSWEAEFF
jgi:hypothetical protein